MQPLYFPPIILPPGKEIRVVWTYPSYGLMDYIRGVMFFDQQFSEICKVTPVIPKKHPMHVAFAWNNAELYKGFVDISLMTHERQWQLAIGMIAQTLQCKDVVHVASNPLPAFWNCQKYQYLLTPLPKYDEPATKQAEAYTSSAYNLIHIRTHDPLRFKAEPLDANMRDRLGRCIEKTLHEFEQDLPVVFICDSAAVRTTFSNYHFTQPAYFHTGFDRMPDKAIVDLFTDVKLIIGATEVVGLHCHDWGYSGFSMIPRFIYNRPYRGIQY